MLGIIGGSGLSKFSSLGGAFGKVVPTPYGDPSGPLVCGHSGGCAVVFLARHGQGHTIPPHRINYRANMWALKDLGVTDVVSVASVGGIRADLGPGCLVIPDQIIDYTWGRGGTYFEDDAPVTHIDFTHPYSQPLRQRILSAALALGESVVDGGVYATTQGPRLETAAEIDRLARDGADIVGMTGMPEAALAREIGLQYAAINVVVNHAAGRGDSHHAISMDAMTEVLRQGMDRVVILIDSMVSI